MSRNPNNAIYHESSQIPMGDIQNELRNQTQSDESDTVINLMNSNTLNSLINEAVNSQNFQQQNSNEQQQQQQQQPESQQNIGNIIVKSLQTSFPFIIIGLVKLLHQHFFGFLVVLGFLTTLHYANKILVNQIQLKEKRSKKKLLMLIGYLVAHISLFFTIFKENNLENCLIFMPPNVKKMDTWNLIWIVVCSDTIFKFLTITVKGLFTLWGQKFVTIQMRGNIYSTIESFSLLYRCLIPIHPWILFLFHFDDTQQTPKTLPLFLCVFYMIFKLNQIYNFLIQLINSVRDLLISLPYGTASVVSETDETVCPICQDRFKNPINLKCQHTFCQDCVCLWLDKENSCPMCRTKVLVNKPKNRDGSTSFSVQWF